MSPSPEPSHRCSRQKQPKTSGPHSGPPGPQLRSTLAGGPIFRSSKCRFEPRCGLFGNFFFWLLFSFFFLFPQGMRSSAGQLTQPSRVEIFEPRTTPILHGESRPAIAVFRHFRPALLPFSCSAAGSLSTTALATCPASSAPPALHCQLALALSRRPFALDSGNFQTATTRVRSPARESKLI